MGVQLKIRRLVRAGTGIEAEKGINCSACVVSCSVHKTLTCMGESCVCRDDFYLSHFIHTYLIYSH